MSEKLRYEFPKLASSLPEMNKAQQGLIAEMHKAVDRLAGGSDMAEEKNRLVALIGRYYENSLEAARLAKQKSTGNVNERQ